MIHTCNIYIYITYINIYTHHFIYIYICIFVRPLLVASFSSQTIPTRQRWQVSPMSSPASFSLCIPAEDGDAMGKMIVVNASNQYRATSGSESPIFPKFLHIKKNSLQIFFGVSIQVCTEFARNYPCCLLWGPWILSAIFTLLRHLDSGCFFFKTSRVFVAVFFDVRDDGSSWIMVDHDGSWRIWASLKSKWFDSSYKYNIYIDVLKFLRETYISVPSYIPLRIPKDSFLVSGLRQLQQLLKPSEHKIQAENCAKQHRHEIFFWQTWVSSRSLRFCFISKRQW